MEKQYGRFIWDVKKEQENITKHKINFTEASKVFLDPGRKIFIDSKHSEKEERYFCIGEINNQIITVRFTYRAGRIRIIGAGYWRKGRNYYEEKN